MSELSYDVVIGGQQVRITSLAIKGGHEIAILDADGKLICRNRSGLLDPEFVNATLAELAS